MVRKAQRGLQQISNSNFYTTPDTPADPTDCDRYPDSPFCGGFPINFRPVGVDLDIVQDSCNLGVQFRGTLGFIKLPPFQIVYRSPTCQLKPKTPVRRFTPAEDNYQFPPKKCDRGLFVNVISGSYDSIHGYNQSGDILFESATTYVVEEILYPNTENHFVGGISSRPANASCKFIYSQEVVFNTNYFSVPLTNSDINSLISRGFIPEGDPYNPQTIWKSSKKATLKYYIHYQFGNISELAQLDGDQIFFNGQPNPVTQPVMFLLDYNNFIQFNPANKIYYVIRDPSPEYRWETLVNSNWYFLCNSERFFLPSPPPPKEPCCKMGCCPDNSNLENLLKLILKKIGSDDLPATVPVSLAKTNSGTTKINNLAQFISYSTKQTNAQLGQFPQEIKIQDADLTQEGNQEKIIKLPNLAESIAEIVGILLILQSESNANLIATMNAMIEAGSSKQAASLAVDYAKANAEYLGYKGKQIERKLPFTFKPGESQIDKMLKSGEVSVKGFDNDDKDDLNDALAPLLEMAAMYRAANFKNLGTNDTLGKLKSILKGAAELSGAVDSLVNTPPPQDPENPNPPEPKKSDWDSFLEETEQGFISQPGITDTTNPYGRPLAQRPRIREIGNDTSDTSNNGQ